MIKQANVLIPKIAIPVLERALEDVEALDVVVVAVVSAQFVIEESQVYVPAP
jgi:hypothetical protein